MKKLLLTLAIIFGGIFATNAQETTFDLTINISGLSSNKGKVLIALYNEEGQFLKKGFKGGMSKITNKKVTYTLKDIPKGEYAVSFFHDENDNNKMDTNFFGIPKEDYGCSNNAKGFMGAPKYKDAKFQLSKDQTIDIKI
ncbi:DUF2141 domain-containing protein [Polaribacter aestuariivivens]|uniref:DUF2141 domain-containing protein n=1 Tax=Polaribacter aestuariivivens TaxID=2304626 RepID=A0A5S3N7S2_9FLAO|nr:DUF2141 domain-containing protein [Polaribacter aestuariivivens]TMM29419.1 DUF2141 domain-containing protein [Polaribacter aestuariivivens]